MPNRIYPSYNPWFLYPFFAWVIIGGVLLGMYDQASLSQAVNTRHTPFLDSFLNGVTFFGEGSVIPIVLLLPWLAIPALRNLWYVFTAGVCCGLSALLVQLIKHLLHSPRPLTVLKDATWLHFNDHWKRLYHYSFPSGHSAGAFSLFCLLAFLLPRRYRPWGLMFFFCAGLVGYSRIYLLAHFFLDVYVGSILGVLFCMVFFGLMHRLEPAFFQEHWQRHKQRIS